MGTSSMPYAQCVGSGQGSQYRRFSMQKPSAYRGNDLPGCRLSRQSNVKVRASFSPVSLGDSKVLVAGATGGTGNNGAGGTTHSTAAPTGPLAAEVEEVWGDVTQYGSLPPAMEGCTAVVCCTGARDASDPLGPFNVDYQGTLNLIAAAKQLGVRHFVLVSSIGADDLLNPLNLFWGVLFWKKRAEAELQRSGLPYTIVRPGGLKSKLKQGESAGSIVMAAPGTFGFPPGKKSGSILRSQVGPVRPCLEPAPLLRRQPQQACGA
ncbi:hypothetical protein Agub_g5234 [Astrephomene gubernaculifera]|uniref:NAD(P)-binding domain-containing protein n=1 Tax=Astrephomene gubernaculifera TaxID=47775 RepID=A0AAD3HJX9_9CHLO|nr:hypothetical protein Agub_g5234 [Astrephomene gubernaculifera]